MQQLITMLISRNYNKNIVKAAIKRALEIPIKTALIRVTKEKCDRTMFAITYNPKLPSISQISDKREEYCAII